MTGGSAYSGYTVALKADGTVLVWGKNSNGQLGDGTMTDRYSPVAVPGLSGVVAVSAGNGYTVALKADGTVVAWGMNSYGQLGDGTVTKRLSPVAVPGLNLNVSVKASQTISFGTAPAVTIGNTGTVSATATSGLAVSFSSATPSICTVSGSTVTGIAAGTCTIAADQAGDTNYSAAVQATQNITIGTAIPAPITNARVFAFAEANYPSLFAGAATAGQYQQYNYRYYPGSGNYLAIDTTGVIYILGTVTGGVVTAVGPVESFSAYITTWEASVGLVY